MAKQQERIHGFCCGSVNAWLVYAPRINEPVKVEHFPAAKTVKCLQLNTKSERLNSHGVNPADPLSLTVFTVNVFLCAAWTGVLRIEKTIT